MKMEQFEGKVIEKFEKHNGYIYIKFTDGMEITISVYGNDEYVEIVVDEN